MPVPPTPLGTFEAPDVNIVKDVPVTVAVEASDVPLMTTVELHLLTDTGDDVFVTTTPLVGVLELSTATADVFIPFGFFRATWPSE